VGEEGLMKIFRDIKLFSLFFAPAKSSESPHKSRLRPKDILEKTAVVDKPIAPQQQGRVKFQATWWYAMCEDEIYIFPGTQVLVVGRIGLTLLVEPIPSLKSAVATAAEETATAPLQAIRTKRSSTKSS
jgi:membrane-bound ClpP family serine protease